MKIHEGIVPMLLSKAEEPPEENAKYLYQLKYDGHRCILSYDVNKGIRLYTKNKNDCTDPYVEFKGLIIPGVKNMILDGEMIVLINQKPCWESAIQRLKTRSSIKAAHLSRTMPAHFVAFDMLLLNDRDLTRDGLEARLELLAASIEPSKHLSIAQNFENGNDLFNAAKELCLEGIVCKLRNSCYEFRRSTSWIKVKNYLYEDVSIVAIRKGKFGWMLQKDSSPKGILEFAPKRDMVKAIYKRIPELKVNEDESFIYIKPIHCKVKFQSYTKSGFMRSPTIVSF